MSGRLKAIDRRRAAAYAVLTAAVLAVVLPFWPGAMDADTIVQLGEIDSGRITDWRAYLIQELYRPFWNLGIGPGFLLLVTTSAMVAGAYLCLRGVLPRLSAAVATAIVLVNPVNYGGLATVGRDNWYLASVLLACGALVRLSSPDAPRRKWWIAGALIAMFLALGSRQNALPAVLPLAIAFFMILAAQRKSGSAPNSERKARVRELLVATAKGTGMAFVMVVVLFAMKPALGIYKTYPEQILQEFELARMSVRLNHVEFSKKSFPAQNLALLAEKTTDTSVNGLVQNAPGTFGLAATPAVRDQLREDWIRTIKKHPWLYFKFKTRVFLHQISLDGPPIWTYHPVVDPNPFGFHFTFSRLQTAAARYASSFSDVNNNGTAPFRTWIWMLLLLPALFVIYRLRPEAWIAYLAQGVTVYTMQIGLFLLAMGVDLRLERQTRVSAMLLIAVAFVLWHQNRYEVRAASASSVSRVH